MRMKSIVVWGFVALLGLTALPSWADDLGPKITAAKTAADHEAIAAEYAKEAKEATAAADAHEKMAKSYEGLGKMGQYHANQHCANLVKSYRDQAKDLQALADAHTAEAKKAGK